MFLSTDKKHLENVILRVQAFLQNELKLSLHPGKIILKNLASGVNFLGWVHFSDHRVLRRKIKERIFIRVQKLPEEAVLQLYLGLLRHGNTHKSSNNLQEQYWLWKE